MIKGGTKAADRVTVADIVIRPMASEEVAECERIMRSLPEWFGIEESILEYVKAISRMETWVAVRDSLLCGFLTLEAHNPHSSEIHVMAVRPDHHRCGIGRALVRDAEQRLVQRGVRLYHVKTLGPSRPNEHYARTRAFYDALGFLPLEENRLWGDVNPCLMYVKHLRNATLPRGGAVETANSSEPE